MIFLLVFLVLPCYLCYLVTCVTLLLVSPCYLCHLVTYVTLLLICDLVICVTLLLVLPGCLRYFVTCFTGLLVCILLLVLPCYLNCVTLSLRLLFVSKDGEREREKERDHSLPQSSNMIIALACSPAPLEKPQGTSGEEREVTVADKYHGKKIQQTPQQKLY